MDQIKDLQLLSGIEFEDLCFNLFQKMGFSVQKTAVSGDGGIDLIAVNHQPLFKGIYIVQCKRYSGSVGVAVIRELYGVVTEQRANKGILITTGHFTSSAIAFAEDKNIELIDNEQLHSLLEACGISETHIGSKQHFLTNPNFDSKKYNFYKSLISQNQCTQELGGKFLFEFLFHYFENDPNHPTDRYLDIIHNGLADEYIRLFDWYASKYYKKGKNEIKTLPYYVRKYKGIAQLCNFDLFDYVQARYNMLKDGQWLKIWTDLADNRGRKFKIDDIPKDIQAELVMAATTADTSRLEYICGQQYYEMLNLYSIFKYFGIKSGRQYIFRHLMKSSSDSTVPLITYNKVVLITNAPYYTQLNSGDAMVLSPSINVVHGKQTIHI